MVMATVFIVIVAGEITLKQFLENSSVNLPIGPWTTVEFGIKVVTILFSGTLLQGTSIQIHLLLCSEWNHIVESEHCAVLKKT